MTTATVKTMSQDLRENITAYGIPLSIYDTSLVDLGPANRSSLERLAILATNIVKYDLPIPPSPFIEMVADRCSGESKQDFSMVMDGKKGRGKSYSSDYIMARYAIAMAERMGQEPKDFFSLENCALLEDTEAIMNLTEEADKYQGILVDDASTAVGSRDFQMEKNKNMNILLTVCRPKRWFLLFNSPVKTHIDLQIRELVDANAVVYKSFHAKGFNILKAFYSEINTMGDRKHTYTPRFEFQKRKVSFWVAFSPDRLEPFKGFAAKYDKARDDATNRLIKGLAEKERLAKNPILKRDAQRQEIFDKYGPVVKQMAGDGESTKAIMRATGLSEYRINMLRGKPNLKSDGE